VRIVIAGPPKTGNVWLKCILAHIYELDVLGPKQTPARPQCALFREWVAGGRFPDGTIFHQHYRYAPELADAILAVPAHLVTIIRDPYDAFVSSYFTIQQHRDDGQRGGRRTSMLDKPLDHPDVLTYLRDYGFRGNMVRAKEWLESGRTLVVRYEGLHRAPLAELTPLTDRIERVPAARLERALEACSAENMRKMGDRKAKHVRAATVGDSRARLGEAHLAIFRERYADLIRALGYEVR
jgi:hypothetical protein